MLVQTPFRDVDEFFDRLAGAPRAGVRTMPMDAYRRGDDVWIHLDLPGIAADGLDISVERNILTVAAERQWHRQDGDQPYLTERPAGTFRRQIQLGDGLDVEHVEATYHDGVLTLRVPVAERAKPRKIQVDATIGANPAQAIDAGSAVSRG